MEALFELQLRLGNEVVPIKVYGSDDRKTLTERVCRDHRIENHFRSLIQSKIVDALNKLATSKKVSRNLQMKVQRFLNFDRSPRKLSEIEEKSLSSSQYSKRNSESFNLSRENSRLNNDKYLSASPLAAQPLLFKEIENIEPRKSQLKSTNVKSSEHSTTGKKVHWHPSGKPTQFDRDLLTAYRNVLKKCKNPEMKSMVSHIVNQLENQQSGQKYPPLPKKVEVSQFTGSRPSSIERHNSLDRYMPSKSPAQPQLFSFQSIEIQKKQPIQKNQRDKQQPVQKSLTTLEPRRLLNLSIDQKSPNVSVGSVYKQRSQKTLEDYEENLARECQRYMKAREKAVEAMNMYRQVREDSPRQSCQEKTGERRITQSPDRYPPLTSQLDMVSPPRQRISPPRQRVSPSRHPTLQQILYLRPVESLPTTQKNSFIKPSLVTCIRPEMHNNRRYRYLNDGQY